MSVIDDTNLMVSVKTYCVPADCQLVLNVTEQIVTLLQNGTILAQRHFPNSRFRLLVLLLKLPGGALHAELLALLYGSEKMVHAVLTTSCEKETTDLIRSPTQQWHTHLVNASQRSPKAKRRELAVVRRSITGRAGLNTLLRDFGFAAYSVHNQGYVLRGINSYHR